MFVYRWNMKNYDIIQIVLQYFNEEYLSNDMFNYCITKLTEHKDITEYDVVQCIAELCKNKILL